MSMSTMAAPMWGPKLPVYRQLCVDLLLVVPSSVSRASPAPISWLSGMADGDAVER